MVRDIVYFSSMKAASIADIKKELKEKSISELIELNLRLTRFKKDNKELLSYLLFEQHDWPAYVQSIKEEMDRITGKSGSPSTFRKKQRRERRRKRR